MKGALQLKSRPKLRSLVIILKNWLPRLTKAQASTSWLLALLSFMQISTFTALAEIPVQREQEGSSQNSGSSLIAVNSEVLIVNFTEEASRSIDRKLSASNLSLSLSEGMSVVTESSVDRLNQTYQVTSITPVFKDLKERQLQTGRSYVELAEEVDKHPQRKPTDATVPNLTNIYVLRFSGSPDIEKIAQEYKKDSNVIYAEPNYIVTLPPDIYIEPNYTLTGATEPPTPNDPDFTRQWALDRIHWKETWPQEQANASITIAIIDTGVDYTHPDLKEAVVAGYDFVYNDNDPLDDNGHGTHAAGIAAATINNGIGIAGVAGGATIMPVKALGKFGLGDNVTVALAIKYAVDHGADIINNSWFGTPSKLMEDMVNYAYSMGVVFVAAAGNEGDSGIPQYPAAYPHVIAVAATNINNDRPSFSSSGPWVDVAAPGASIYSTDLNRGYSYKSGTSMATPHVSGLAALILSKKPNLTPNVVENIIITSADDLGPPGRDNYYGSGIINVQKALQPSFDIVARITSPIDNEDISSLEVPIKGSVGGKDFAGYKIDFAPGINPAESDWQTFKPFSSTPVENNILAVWYITYLKEGTYTLRLQVTTKDNRSFEDRIVVNIQYRLPLLIDGFSVNGLYKGKLPSGATVDLVVYLRNTTHNSKSVLQGVTAALTTDDPYIEIINSQASFGDIAGFNVKGNSDQPYSLKISKIIPAEHKVKFNLKIHNSTGNLTLNLELSAVRTQPIFVIYLPFLSKEPLTPTPTPTPTPQSYKIYLPRVLRGPQETVPTATPLLTVTATTTLSPTVTATPPASSLFIPKPIFTPLAYLFVVGLGGHSLTDLPTS